MIRSKHIHFIDTCVHLQMNECLIIHETAVIRCSDQNKPALFIMWGLTMESYTKRDAHVFCSPSITPPHTHIWLVFSRWFNCSNDTISMVFMFSGRGRACARVMKPHNFLFSCRSDPGPRSVRNFSRTVPQSSRGLHPEHKCSVKKILFKSFIYPTKNHFKLFFLQINYKWMK